MKKLIPVLALLATVAIYFPGLGGELVFDDRANLAPVFSWHAGETSWQQVVFENGAGPLGRPLSMASFLANAALTGDSPLGMKAGNLLLHLATGMLLLLLLRGLAARDRRLNNHESWLPLVLTAAWLLHPLMVGTVLYVVQRMAILSALFIIATMLAYLHGRTRIEQGRTTSGTLWLFLGVPTLVALAAFSKENGLLAPLLCGVIEWAYFAPRQGAFRPRQVRLFLVAFVAMPVLAALAILALKPELYFAGYANRSFGPADRLLTQSRVLFDYAGKTFLPAGPNFSIFRDDYSLSSDLFSPPTTAFAILGWMLLVGAAMKLRRSIPGFSAGIGIFLVGHLMESSIFPLLIYFEHRNYLPAIGLLWATAALLAAAAPRVSRYMDHPKPVLFGGIAAILIVLAGATYSRSHVWSSNEKLVRQSLRAYPDSRHARMEIQRIELAKMFPNFGEVRAHSEHLTALEKTSTQAIGLVGLIRLDCILEQRADPDRIEALFQLAPEAFEADLYRSLEMLANTVNRVSCENMTPPKLAKGLIRLVENSELPDHVSLVWRTRFLAARLFYEAESPEKALEQAEHAFEASDRDPAVGMMIVGLRINLGRIKYASDLLEKLKALIPESDSQGQQLIDAYEAAINQSLLEDFRPSPNTWLNLQPEADNEQ